MTASPALGSAAKVSCAGGGDPGQGQGPWGHFTARNWPGGQRHAASPLAKAASDAAGLSAALEEAGMLGSGFL